MSIASEVAIFSLRILWELPQNILGAFLFLFIRISGNLKRFYFKKGVLFIETKKIGVSLGVFIFWCRTEKVRKHEYGHSLQSLLFGCLYLIIIGIPSVFRVVLFTFMLNVYPKFKYGSYEYVILARKYYKGYPENWAEKLGGNI